MSSAKVGSIWVGEAMRIYEGDQRVLPPASPSSALSASVTVIGQLRACATSAAASAAASPAAPWPTTIKLGRDWLMSRLMSYGRQGCMHYLKRRNHLKVRSW